MKHLLKLLLASVLLLSAVLMLSACSGEWAAPYPSLDDEGYTVSVKFDANGGAFKNTERVTVVDVFRPADAKENANGEKALSLLSPDDAKRGENAFPVSRINYVFAGWYRERTLRTDDAGNPLDENGIPTAVSGKEQGYLFSDPWDFASDTLTVDPEKEYSSSEPALTLYAAWVPYTVYEFYAPDPTSGAMTLFHTETIEILNIPTWNEKTGKLDMLNFPKRDGMTLDGVFTDAAMTEAVTDSLRVEIDTAHGIAKSGTVKLYTKWMDGTWFRISTAEQFVQNSRIDGSYIITSDLDFTGLYWSAGLSKGQFTGTILGNGHTLRNITLTQTDISQLRGGLFGSIEAGARIEDVTFENVTYTVNAGSRMTDPSFGLLAGILSTEATLKGVSISGELLISESCYPASGYQIGLISGNGVNGGIDASSVTCRVAEEGSERITVTVEEDGSVTLTFLS